MGGSIVGIATHRTMALSGWREKVKGRSTLCTAHLASRKVSGSNLGTSHQNGGVLSCYLLSTARICNNFRYTFLGHRRMDGIDHKAHIKIADNQYGLPTVNSLINVNIKIIERKDF